MIDCSAFPSQRRGYLAISLAILKASKNGIRKTNLITSVSLNYGQFIKYIDFLKTQGFINEHESRYLTTDKGLKLIKEFESSKLISSMLAV